MLKNKISTINFNQVQYPSLCPKLVSYQNWKYYLTDKEEKWINELKKLYMESSLHQNILNILKDMVLGTGLISGNGLDETIIKRLKYNDILKKLIFDYSLYGGCYLYLKWNDEHTKIAEIKHIKYEQIRIGDIEEEVDDIKVYYHCTNWSKWKQKDITPLIKYNTNPDSDHQQIYPLKYDDLFIYPTPYYQGCIRNIQEAIEIDKYYLNLINTGLAPNKMIVIPGNIDEKDKEDLEYILKNNYSGSEGFKNLIV